MFKVQHKITLSLAIVYLFILFCRTLKAYEAWLKRGSRGSDYLLPTEMLVQINVIIEFKAQALKLCALDAGDMETKVCTTLP